MLIPMEQYIFGHRGASGYAQENTLEAFDLAIKQGAHGVELDVHLTADDQLVVAHDETIDRVANGTGHISEMTLAELKHYTFNKTHPEYANATIPTLQEVFQLIKPSGMRINIELKNSLIDYPELERKTIELAAKEGMLDRILFSSFNHYSLLRVKKLMPEMFCGLLYEATLYRPWAYASLLGVDGLHPHFSEILFDRDECKRAHAAGIAVNPWTVNREEDITESLKVGADIIISNFPDVGLRCLEKCKA